MTNISRGVSLQNHTGKNDNHLEINFRLIRTHPSKNLCHRVKIYIPGLYISTLRPRDRVIMMLMKQTKMIDMQCQILTAKEIANKKLLTLQKIVT